MYLQKNFRLHQACQNPFLNLKHLRQYECSLFMHLITTFPARPNAVGRRRQDLAYYFLFDRPYDICLFNSTYILKAIKTSNICFYLTMNLNSNSPAGM